MGKWYEKETSLTEVPIEVLPEAQQENPVETQTEDFIEGSPVKVNPMVGSADPVSAVANAAQALFHLVTASIPSDELQRERFKIKYPLIYARIRKRVYRQILGHLRFRWHEPVDAYVRLVAGAFPKDEQDYMITLARATLKRN